MPLSDALERLPAAGAAALPAAGREPAVPAGRRASATLPDSAWALRATTRAESPLASTSSALSGSAATKLLSTLIGPTAE